MTLEARRAALLEHLAGDNHGEAQEWCDRHRGYVDEGRTQPFGAGSIYRICDGCTDESQRLSDRSVTYCPDCGYLLAFHVRDRCPQELGPEGARGRSEDA